MNLKLEGKNNSAGFKLPLAATIITLLVVTLYQGSASAEGSVLDNVSYIKTIKKEHIETLETDSKWRFGALGTLLNNVLSNDLTDTSSCDQVWHFSAEESEEAQEWCRAREKGTTTNSRFLLEFHSNRRH